MLVLLGCKSYQVWLKLQRIVDSKDGLSLEEKYLFGKAPITTKSTIIVQTFNSYIASVIKKKPNHYKPSITLQKKQLHKKDLLLVEDEDKKISLYLWLSYKLPNLFPDHDKAFILEGIF